MDRNQEVEWVGEAGGVRYFIVQPIFGGCGLLR